MSRLNTVTNTYLLPKVVDTVLNSNVLLTKILSKPEKWRGEKIRKVIKVEKNTQGNSFSSMDTFGTAAVNTRQYLEFPAKFYEIPVVIPLTDASVNKSDPNRIVDLAAIELESSGEDMADSIGTIIYGDGTGNSSKDFNGLGNIVDDGTTASIYGTLSRTTYPTLKSTVTASGGTLTLAKMASLYYAITSGSIKPTMGVCDETVFSLYEQLLTPMQRMAFDVTEMRDKKGIAGGTGFTALSYKGIPIYVDEKATAQTLFLLNENFLEWTALPMAETQPINYGIEIEGNDYTNVKGLGFSWSGWIVPVNQAAIIGHIYLGGEFWCSNPKRQGKLTGITGV